MGRDRVRGHPSKNYSPTQDDGKQDLHERIQSKQRDRSRQNEKHLITWSCIHYSGKEDVSQSVNAEFIEIIVGEIQLETTPEISDSRFQFISAQTGNGSGFCLKTTPRAHPRNP